MKLLVTGGAGFIGSAVVRQAIAEGHYVVNVDALTYAANLANVSAVAAHSAYAFEQVDICDGPALAAVFAQHAPDAVMHLAAESHVDRSIDGPAAFVQTNLVGTFTLLEAARAYWIAQGAPDSFRFHHVSTDEVFGSLGAEGAFNETAPYAPNSPYAASKAGSDHMVRAWGHTYGLPIVISNCSNNYGPYQFPEKLIPVVIMAAVEGRPIPIYGKGENVRDWLYVEDHAGALLQIVEHGAPFETYNVGGHGECANLKLVQMICAILDEIRPTNRLYSDLITFVKDRPGHDMRYAIDAAKLTSELGWSPKTDLNDGLRKTVTWYLDNQDWLADLKARQGVGQRLGLIE